MPLSQNAKIGIAIAIVAVIVIPTVIILAWPQPTPPSGPTVTFFGQNVTQNATVFLSQIEDPNNFAQIVNKSLTYVNNAGMTYSKLYTGVSLYDLIVYSGVNYSNSTALRIWGSDNVATRPIPIKLCQQNPQLILLAYERDGTALEGTADGPYIVAVNDSIVAPKVSSQWLGKKAVKIEFLNYPDWNVTIIGNVQKTSIIYYAELCAANGLTRVTMEPLNNTKISPWTSQIRNMTGVTVKSLFDYSKIVSNTSITKIRFIASDNYKSNNVTWTFVVNNQTDILVAYAQEGIPISGTNGYIESAVDFNIDPTVNSGKYWVYKLLYIEIF